MTNIQIVFNNHFLQKWEWWPSEKKEEEKGEPIVKYKRERGEREGGREEEWERKRGSKREREREYN